MAIMNSLFTPARPPKRPRPRSPGRAKGQKKVGATPLTYESVLRKNYTTKGAGLQGFAWSVASGPSPPALFPCAGEERTRWRTIQRLIKRMRGSTFVYPRSEEHTSELQSLMRSSYAVFCLKKKMKSDDHLTNCHLTEHASLYIKKSH